MLAPYSLMLQLRILYAIVFMGPISAPMGCHNTIGKPGYSVLEVSSAVHNYFACSWRFLNTLIADLILVLSRIIMAAVSIDRGKVRRGRN
jgi:hypothetical protein